MEQTLLPPSQTRLSVFSVDSRFADTYYAGTADFMIRLPSTVRNVMRISVTSVEIPQVAYVFTPMAGNTGFSVGGVAHDISAGNYTPAQMVVAINGLSAGIDCSYNAITNRFGLKGSSATVSVNLTSSDLSGVPCVDLIAIAERKRFWGLGYYLGFRSKYMTLPSSGYVWAMESPQLMAPPYMLLQLRCPDMMENTLHRTESGSFVQALAKVVLRYGYYHINYDDLGNLLRKENVFQQPTAITQFRISLVDAYGNLVDMGDTDWSVSFEIMDVISSCKYTALNSEYGRC